MPILKMTDKERNRISEQHKKLEKIVREKKDELKKGLQEPKKEIKCKSCGS